MLVTAFYPLAALAFDINWEGMIISVVGGIIRIITKLLSWILSLFLDLLVWVASYNHFVDNQAPTAVDIGWRLIRDLANMMFIVIILIMSFGTILKLQTYHAKSMLGKFIIMVFLVNFSKTIAGFFIDFAQIVMMTFVNAFKDTAALDMAIGMQLDKFANTEGSGDISNMDLMNVLTAMLLTVALLAVACGVVIAMTVILVFRIIMIWILVIFSPIAYVCQLLPQTKKYATQWWEQFGKYLVVGPVMAFFLWLSLSIVIQMARSPVDIRGGGGFEEPKEADKQADTSGPEYESYGPTQISSAQAMFNYVIAIALLWAGLTMTQQMGVMGGSIAGKMQSGLQAMGKKIVKAPLKGGGWAYSTFARKMKAGKLFGGDPTKGKPGFGYGVEINPANLWKKFRGGQERRKREEEILGSRGAGEQLRKGGWRGFVAGAGSSGHYETYFRGLGYKEGFKQLAGRGSRESVEAKKKTAEAKTKEAKEMEEAAEQENRPDVARQILKNEADDKALDLQDAQQEHDELSGEDLKKRREEVEMGLGKLDKMDITNAPQIRQLEEQLKEIEKEEEDLKSPEKTARKTELEGVIAKLSGDTGEVAQAKKRLEDFNSNKGTQDAEAKRILDERISKRQSAMDHIAGGGFSDEQRRVKEQEKIDINLRLDGLNSDLQEAKDVGADTGGLESMIEEAKKNQEAVEQELADDKDGEAVVTGEEKDTAEIDRLDAENTKDQEARDMDYLTEDKREGLRAEAQEAKKIAKTAQEDYLAEAAAAPRDLEDRLELYGGISERAKLFNTSNEYELMSLYENAKDRNNVVDMMAIATQATRVGHANELLNNQKAKNDYYYDERTDKFMNENEWKDNGRQGELIIKKDNNLDSDAMGMHALIRDDFEPRIGRQAAFEFENDIATMAQGIHHWTYAQTNSADPTGMFTQRGLTEWNNAVATERGKVDFEKRDREGNRLAIGSENWVDPNDHSKGRYFKMHDYAIKEMVENWRRSMMIVDRNRQNQSKVNSVNQDQSFIYKVIEDHIKQTVSADLLPQALDEYRRKYLKPIMGGKEGGMTSQIDQEQIRIISRQLGLEAEQSRIRRARGY